MLVKAKETIWLEGLPPHNWRNIAITPTMSIVERARDVNYASENPTPMLDDAGEPATAAPNLTLAGPPDAPAEATLTGALTSFSKGWDVDFVA